MVIVDTQFLFALQETDPHHSIVKTILEKKPSQLEFKVPSVALIETLLVLKSQKIEPILIQETFNLLSKIFHQEKINVLPCTPKEIAQGVQLDTLAEGKFFDALIASAALHNHEELIADDPFFKKVPNLEVYTFKNFQKKAGRK